MARRTRGQEPLFETKNLLYLGDNLTVLRSRVREESVDLVYLDPPFKSDQNYNLLFKARDGRKPAAQIRAFEDTWRWDQASFSAYHEMIEEGPEHVSRALQAFRAFLGDTDMLAYLSMMAPRLVRLEQVLKPTGTLYLHCDRAASHYLKMLLDAVFGPENFLNEVTWRRTYSHGNVARNFGSITDHLLVYVKSKNYTWAQQYAPFSADYVDRTFRFTDPDGRRWQSVTLRNPSPRPNLHYPYTASNGATYRPHPNGWVCDERRMRQLDSEGRLHFPSKTAGALRLKMYLDESPGIRLQNLWDDIGVLGSRAEERIGFPTQKPEALLERILLTSSEEGQVVLDPFCGCGTAVSVAQRLGRRWIGIDIADVAVDIIRERLEKAYGSEVSESYDYRVVPGSLEHAEALASQDPYQFQWWVVEELGGSPSERRRGADKGIDGRLYFHEDRGGETRQIVISVKSGRTGPDHVRDLRGVIEREEAALGALVTLREPTRKMRLEASSAGFYNAKVWGRDYPRLQIITVPQLLEGGALRYPSLDRLVFHPEEKGGLEVDRERA